MQEMNPNPDYTNPDRQNTKSLNPATTQGQNSDSMNNDTLSKTHLNYEKLKQILSDESIEKECDEVINALNEKGELVVNPQELQEKVMFNLALTALEGNDHKTAFNYFNSSFDVLVQKSFRSEEDLEFMSYIVTLMTSCVSSSDEAYETLLLLNDKRNVFRDDIKRDDLELVALIDMYLLCLDTFSKWKDNLITKHFFTYQARAISEYISKKESLTSCNYLLISDSLERLFVSLNKYSDIFLEYKLEDETINIFKTTLKLVNNISRAYKRCISNEQKQLLEDRVYDAVLLMEFKKGNSVFLEDLLKKEMTNNAPMIVAEITSLLLKVYVSKGELNKIKINLFEPYIYVLEKLKEAPKTKRSFLLLNAFFKLTVEIIDYYANYKCNYKRAEAYALTLRKIMESKRANKILGYNFSDIMKGDKWITKKIYGLAPILTRSYLMLLDNITSLSKFHKFNSSFKSINEISTIRRAVNTFLEVLKEDDPEEFVSLVLDRALDSTDRNCIYDAKRYIKKLQDYRKSVKAKLENLEIEPPIDPELEIGYYYAICTFSYIFNYSKMPKCFDKMRKVYDDSKMKYDERFYDVIIYYLEYYIDRGDCLRAANVLLTFQEYLKQNNLKETEDHLKFLDYKKSVFELFEDRKKDVIKERRNLRKKLKREDRNDDDNEDNDNNNQEKKS